MFFEYGGLFDCCFVVIYKIDLLGGFFWDGRFLRLYRDLCII